MSILMGESGVSQETFFIVTVALISGILFLTLCIFILMLYLTVRILHYAQRLEAASKPQTHCFRTDTIQPEEELAKRGYSMYSGTDSITTRSQSSRNAYTNPYARPPPAAPMTNKEESDGKNFSNW